MRIQSSFCTNHSDTAKSQMITRTLRFTTVLMGTLFCSAVFAFPNISGDNALQACIEKTAKKNNWTTAEQVTELKCHKKKIVSIDGINKLTNLKKLSLFNNRIEAADFSGLDKLEELNVARNKLKIMSISQLPQLKKLYLFSNNAKSLQLNGLPQLVIIKANDNKLLEFRYSNLPLLEKIYIFDNKLKDFDIYNLPKMKYLDCRQNPMPDELYDRMDAVETATILHDGNADDW